MFFMDDITDLEDTVVSLQLFWN